MLSDDTARDPARTRLAGRIRPADGLDDRAWDIAAAGANAIARAVRETTGLRTVLHNHCATFVEASWEIEALMQRTDSSLVGLCLDTGHCAFGGGDPVAAVEQWRDRIWHMHFKDCEPAVKARAAKEEWGYLESVRNGVFCELGQGQVDFTKVLARLRSAAYDGWIVVEQDVLPSMGTPAESAQRNRDYLRSLGV